MATAIFMPKQGMSMEEGTLVRWLKGVGDTVEMNEPIMEIETDKIVMEAEAPASGVILAELIDENTTVPVLSTIGWIGQSGEKIPEGANNASTTPSSNEEIKTSGEYDFDVAVIGAGPGGYCAAIRAAQLGGKVIIFEKDKVGGTCLNRGCIPTKTFVKTGEAINTFNNCESRGIVLPDNFKVSVDMAKVVDYKNNVVKKLTGGVSALLKSNGVKVVTGDALLKDAHSIKCGDVTYSAGKIILCTGSKVRMIPIDGIDNKNVITSDDLLDIDHVPESLVIIGGGIVGCEFAQPFARFGSKVTIIEAADRITSGLDEELSYGIEKGLKAEGIDVYTNTSVKRIYDKDGKTFVDLGDTQIEAEKVLLCVGRTPVLDVLGEISGKFETENGHISVNEYCETSVSGIYAVGDITSVSGLASTAIKMGETAAQNAMGQDSILDLSKSPSIIHTNPEAVSIGLTQAQAEERYPGKILTGKFPFSGNGMCLASGETEGFVKVIAESDFGEIVGVHILGADAAEMGAEAVDLMSMEISVYEAASIIHAHPTMSEAFMEACADAISMCIHLPKKKQITKAE